MVEAKNEYNRTFDFEPPATEAQIQEAEQLLGVALPDGVRELLAEFNGVWDRTDAKYPEITYLDLKHMSVDVLEYFRKCRHPITGNPLPPEQDLNKVVFIYQSNGFGDLWGVCVEDVAGHRAGEVVRLDHEIGELESSHKSLTDFVTNGPWSEP